MPIQLDLADPPTDTEEHPFRARFRHLLGRPAWGAHKGHGSFVTMEFGAPRLEVREPRASISSSPRVRRLMSRRLITVRGDHHLWIYCCHWRIEAHGRAMAQERDKRRRIERAVAELDGQRLVRAEIDPATGRSAFQFDLGGRLETWPFTAAEWGGPAGEVDQWMLHGPEDVLSYRADGLLEIEPRDPEVAVEVPTGTAA